VRIDLHTHSTASDGSLSPAQLVAAAVAGKLDVLALTDHDTVDGVAAARDAAEGTALRLVPGLEVSTHHPAGEQHVLGYFVDVRDDGLTAYTRTARGRRQERMRGMLERLEALGVVVTMEQVLAAAPAGANMGRPHLARALTEAGYVHTPSEAFDRWIGDGGPAYLPMAFVSPAQAIALIHAAGGLAVWAHPRADIFRAEIRALAASGLDGVECWRPRTLPVDTRLFVETAASLGLLTSGGSDWHGDWHGPLGSFAVTAADVRGLLARGGIQ
jgi:hypothetical protein